MKGMLDVLGGLTASPVILLVGAIITTGLAIYLSMIAINLLAFIFGMSSFNDSEK